MEATHSKTLLVRSDYTVVSATHSVANYNAVRQYGIVLLFKKNISPTSAADVWVNTGSSFASQIPADEYGASVALHADSGSGLLVVGAPADSLRATNDGAGTPCGVWSCVFVSIT